MLPVQSNTGRKRRASMPVLPGLVEHQPQLAGSVAADSACPPAQDRTFSQQHAERRPSVGVLGTDLIKTPTDSEQKNSARRGSIGGRFVQRLKGLFQSKTRQSKPLEKKSAKKDTFKKGDIFKNLRRKRRTTCKKGRVIDITSDDSFREVFDYLFTSVTSDRTPIGHFCDIELKRLEKMLRYPEMVALALTDREFELFCQVQAEDYVTYVTQSIDQSPPTVKAPDVNDNRSPTMNDLIQRFLKVRRWVLEVLVCQPDLEHRLAVLSCLLRVAEVCVALGNLGTVLQILTGLRTPELRPFWQTLADRKLSTPPLTQLCDNYLGPEPSQEYVDTLARALETPTNRVVPFFGFLLNEIKAIHESYNEIDNEDNDDQSQSDEQPLNEIRHYQSRYELVGLGDNELEDNRGWEDDLNEFNDKASMPFGTRFLPVNAGLVARDIHLMHAGTTVVRFDTVRGTPTVVCLRLEPDDRTLSWHTPDWSSLSFKSGTKPKDFEFRSKPVPSPILYRYQNDVWVLDNRDNDGYVDLFAVKEINTDRINCRDVESVLHSYELDSDADPNDPQVYLTLIYGKTLAQNQLVTFLMPSSIWSIWSHGLRKLVKAYREEDSCTISWAKEKYINQFVQKNPCRGPTPADAIEVFGGMKWSPEQTQVLNVVAFHAGVQPPELSTITELEIPFQDFADLLYHFLVGIREDLVSVFSKYASQLLTTPRNIPNRLSIESDNADRNLDSTYSKLMISLGIAKNHALVNVCMKFEDFERFLEEEQGESHSEDEILALIERFELNESLAESKQLSFEAFVHFMNSSENDLVCTGGENEQNMSHPLSHYFINSSHNTYLVGHQLRGESSVEIYSAILLTGCRCVELDCWDGDDGWPIIYHGHTLTTKISFRETLVAINKSAFVRSPYPVILSIENHCGLEQQEKMAILFREVFGNRLVSEFLEEPNFTEDGRLPSPADLKYRFLIKNKKIPVMNSQARRGSVASMSISSDSGTASDYDEFKDEEDDKPPSFDEIIEYLHTPGQSSSDKTHNRPRPNESLPRIQKSSSFCQSNETDSDNTVSFMTRSNSSPNLSPLSSPKRSRISRISRPPSFKETLSENEEDNMTPEEDSCILPGFSSIESLPKREKPIQGKPRRGRRASVDIVHHSASSNDVMQAPEHGEKEQFTVNKPSEVKPLNRPRGRRKSLGDALSIANGNSNVLTDYIQTDDGIEQSYIKRGSSEKKACAEKKDAFPTMTKSRSATDMREWKKDQSSSKKAKVHPELSKLVIYTEAVRFKEHWLGYGPTSRKKKNSDHQTCYQMSSVDEKLSAHLWDKFAISLRHHCESHLIRVYPLATRFNSTNFTPLQHWASGIQMVALNHQTDGLEMQVNSAMFERAGGCGYVLKPPSMWNKFDSMYNWFNPYQLNYSGKHTQLDLHLLSGQYVNQKCLQSSVFVEVEVIGIPADCKKQKTKVVDDNSLNPIWNDHFEFQVVFPELAFLRMSVFAIQGNAGQTIAQRTIPIAEIRQGYRNVWLRSSTDRPFALSSLLVCARLTEGAAWKPPPLSSPSVGRRSSIDLCANHPIPRAPGRPSMPSSKTVERPMPSQPMAYFCIEGVSNESENTLVEAQQSVTAKELIHMALQKEGRDEDPSEMVLIEKTVSENDTGSQSTGATLRVLEDDENVHEVMVGWRDEERNGTDSSLVLYRREDAQKIEDPTHDYVVETGSMQPGVGPTVIKASRTITTGDLIEMVLHAEGRTDDPEDMILIEKTVPDHTYDATSPVSVLSSRALHEEELVYTICQGWLSPDQQGTNSYLVLTHKEDVEGIEIFV